MCERVILTDYCEWWPEGELRPCYGRTTHVLVRPGGHTIRFTCREHAASWASRMMQGLYRVLERAEWEAQGTGYRDPEPGR